MDLNLVRSVLSLKFKILQEKQLSRLKKDSSQAQKDSDLSNIHNHKKGPCSTQIQIHNSSCSIVKVYKVSA